MQGKIGRLATLVVLLSGLVHSEAFAQGWQFGMGLKATASRLEGDLNDAIVSPMVSGFIRVMPTPYLAFDGEVGFSSLNSNGHPNPTYNDFKTTIVPVELSAVFSFLPLGKVNPYIFIGGGGVWWRAVADVSAGKNTTLEDDVGWFAKTGGGIEYRISRGWSFNFGGTFRLSSTDGLDQLRQGDEDDQVLDVYTGVTYYFNQSRDDRDHDGIPDELDLMPDVAEDRDGYLEHDGIPEKNPSPAAMRSGDASLDGVRGSAPMVIHYLVGRAEAGKDLPIKANVYSDMDLRVVAALYRPIGTRNWNVVKLQNEGENLYKGEIPGYAMTTDGLEYCVIAVDETLSGVGYSGLPSKPIYVRVSSGGKGWRFVGGIAGAAAIGAATYLVIRKQE